MSHSRTPITSVAHARRLVANLRRRCLNGFTVQTEIVGETLADAHVAFAGGLWGTHTLRLQCSSPERIQAHWEGYAAQHGLLQPRVGSRVTFAVDGVDGVVGTGTVLAATPHRTHIATRDLLTGVSEERWVHNHELRFQAPRFAPAAAEVRA